MLIHCKQGASCYRQSGRKKMLIHLNRCDMNSTVHVFCLIDGLIGGLVGWLD